MANKFLSKKIIIPAAILFGGLLIASSVFILANFTDAKLLIASQSSQWTQEAGLGISVPACSSASPSMTCDSSNQPVVTFTLSGDVGPIDWIYINYPDPIWSGSIAAGSVTVPSGILANNTSYTYRVQDATTVYNDNTPFTTPNCAPFDYSLSNSGNITVQQGNSNSNTITATLLAGATESVSFSASGLPSGATAYFVPTSCSPNCSSALTISTAPSTPASTYPITVTGNPLGKTTTFNLIVTPTPPGDFTLSIGGGLACNSVPLSWTASTGADGYRILKGAARVDISPYQPYTALNFVDYAVSENTTYLYQIEAYNSAGTNRSNARNVTTPYCPPTLNFSGNPTSIFQGQSSTLTWDTTYTTSCTASSAPTQSDWSGSKALNGNQVVVPLPPPSVTYTMTCTGPGGSIGPQSVIINITPLGLPQWKEIIPR